MQHDIEEGAPIIDEGVLPDISEDGPNPSNNNRILTRHKEDAFLENGEKKP